MYRSISRGSRRTARSAAAASAVLLVCAGCVAPIGGHRADQAARTTPPTRLSVLDWAVLDGRLSVELRNSGAATIGRARTVVAAFDRHGTLVAATSGPDSTPCCLVAALAPGATTSVFVQLGTAAARVRRVSVTAVGIGAATPLPAPTTAAVALQTDAAGATVRAEVTTGEPVRLLARAVLGTPNGRLVTAVGRLLPCTSASAATPVSIDVGEQLPPQTLVRSVSVVALSRC